MAGYMPYGYQAYGQPAAPYTLPRQDYMGQVMQRPLQPPQQNGQSGFLCRPVTSKAEAEVAQIPFDGTTAWFYDTSADVMYAKTFNFADGTAPVLTYTREVPAPPVQYATVAQLNAVLEELAQLKQQGKVEIKNDTNA